MIKFLSKSLFTLVKIFAFLINRLPSVCQLLKEHLSDFLFSQNSKSCFSVERKNDAELTVCFIRSVCLNQQGNKLLDVVKWKTHEGQAFPPKDYGVADY